MSEKEAKSGYDYCIAVVDEGRLHWEYRVAVSPVEGRPMWMTQYINEIQKKLVSQYGFVPDARGSLQVPDGEYSMVIDGRLDRVRIQDGMIHCGRFLEEFAPRAGSPEIRRCVVCSCPIFTEEERRLWMCYPCAGE